MPKRRKRHPALVAWDKGKFSGCVSPEDLVRRAYNMGRADTLRRKRAGKKAAKTRKRKKRARKR